MPRDKQVDPFEGLDTSQLEPLEPWQAAMIAAKLEGATQQAAYNLAKPQNNLSPAAAKVVAFRAFSHPQVVAWMTAITLHGMGGSLETKQEHVAIGKALRLESKLTGNYGAAATFHQSIGKACGLYEQRVKLETSNTDSLKAELADLLGLEPAMLDKPESGAESN